MLYFTAYTMHLFSQTPLQFVSCMVSGHFNDSELKNFDGKFEKIYSQFENLNENLNEERINKDLCISIERFLILRRIKDTVCDSDQ